MANVIQTFPKGTGSGGGHTILDGEGTALTQEKNLQIEGLDVADNSTNEATVFSPIGLNADSIDDIAEANSVVPAVIIGDSNNYSTNEKVIGKWIDGKAIYQKTIQITSPASSGTVYISTSNWGIDKIVKLDGIIDAPYQFINSNWSYSTSNNCGALFYVKNEQRIYQFLGTGANAYFNSPEYITVQYTKTT